MVLTNEIDTLTMTVTDSVDLAAEGRIADDDTCLLSGLHRSEETVAQGTCGIEKCQAQLEAAQRGPIQLALRAFVRLEEHWQQTGVSWYAAKTDIIRTAIRAYLARPRYPLATDSTL